MINMMSMINYIKWYDINITKAQIYFIYAYDNYAKLHKSADSYIKSHI